MPGSQDRVCRRDRLPAHRPARPMQSCAPATPRPRRLGPACAWPGSTRLNRRTSMEIGEIWAYRARQQDALARVEILKIGTKRPPRVQVRFLDEQFEGRQDWVPPARLKTRWEDAEQWLAAERRWQAVMDASVHARESVEHKAAEFVFDRPAAEEFIDGMDAYRYAVLTVTDPAAFAA